jgi:hypothetical protein
MLEWKLVAIPVVIALIIPLGVALIPSLGMMVCLPIRRIGIGLAMVVAVIIMAIADRETQADAADMDAHDFFRDCRTGRGERKGRQSKRDDCAIQHFMHGLFLLHCLQQRNCGAS